MIFFDGRADKGGNLENLVDAPGMFKHSISSEQSQHQISLNVLVSENYCPMYRPPNVIYLP